MRSSVKMYSMKPQSTHWLCELLWDDNFSGNSTGCKWSHKAKIEAFSLLHIIWDELSDIVDDGEL